MFHELKSQGREATGFEPSVHAYEGVQMGGRRFSILSALFGCEVEVDAWVGGCRWGAPAENFLKAYENQRFKFCFENVFLVLL